jgi:CheY-like chemotaxis protein
MPTILVADDEPAILDLLVEVLRDEGYAVLAAADGPEVLELLGRGRPDLLLMDVMMPGLDGRAVVRRVRERPELDGVPVVLMSAAAHVDPAELAVAFLPKPFDLDRLLGAISTALGGPLDGR